MTPTELVRSLQEARGFGCVSCDWRPRIRANGSVVDDLDEYAFEVLGSDPAAMPRDGYRELPIEEAHRTANHWMRHSLAYPRHVLSAAPPDAVDPFFQVFSASARFFTNTNEIGNQWFPKTGHTFDLGIVAIDDMHIGLLWFADED